MTFNNIQKRLLIEASNIAKTLDIPAIVMDGMSIRGENKTDGVFILMDTSELEIDLTVAISRLDAFHARLRMFDNPKLSYNLVNRDNGESFCGEIVLSSGKSTVTFKCADPTTIKAPKALKDPVTKSILLKQNDIKTIHKAIHGMKSDKITVSSHGQDATFGDVTFALSDTDGDVFKHSMEGALKHLVDPSSSSAISSTYMTSTIKAAFRLFDRAIDDTDAQQEISITSRGIMIVTVSDIPVYLFPSK